MRFIKYFKESQNRGGISEEEFLTILKENCKQWINNPFPIVRAINSREKFLHVDPKARKRRSLSAETTGNYNVLLLSDLPSWKGYPRRDEALIALIGEVDTHFLRNFGESVYLVIPYDNAKFGVAPANDIWMTRIGSTSGIQISDNFLRSLSRFGLPDTSIEDFVKKATEIINNKERVLSDEASFLFEILRLVDKHKVYTEEEVLDSLIKSISPDNLYGSNNKTYELVRYNELKNVEVGYGCEVWTDSKCLLVKIGIVDDYIDDDVIEGVINFIKNKLN